MANPPPSGNSSESSATQSANEQANELANELANDQANELANDLESELPNGDLPGDLPKWQPENQSSDHLTGRSTQQPAGFNRSAGQTNPDQPTTRWPSISLNSKAIKSMKRYNESFSADYNPDPL